MVEIPWNHPPANVKKLEVFIRFSYSRRFLAANFDFPSRIDHYRKLICTSTFHCDLIDAKNELHLNTTPCSNSSFHYADHRNLISFSTSNHTADRVHLVRHLELNLQDLQNQHHRLFHQLTSLRLTINDRCSADCFELRVRSVHLQ